MEIEEANDNMAKIEALENNGENYIKDYFEDIKREVDLRREDLKLKIDDYSDSIIQSKNKKQVDWIRLSKEVNHLQTEIYKSSNQLDELINRFLIKNFLQLSISTNVYRLETRSTLFIILFKFSFFKDKVDSTLLDATLPVNETLRISHRNEMAAEV